MIKKELDTFDSNDKFAIAGRRAEEKMAFYLKRYFSDSHEILVLNHIRLEHNADAAQIDHLVLHPFGMIIIESKSVNGKVQIKEDGQWIRWYGPQSKGMASPLIQARLQAKFLKDYLNQFAIPKDFFYTIPVTVKVAISDDGIILWPKDGKIPEVSKADQIADIVLSTLEQAKNAHEKPLLSTQHLAKLADFLCKSHKPLTNKQTIITDEKIETEQESNSPKEPEISPSCNACNSHNLKIMFARTYYFNCLDCGKNMPIKTICPSCNAQNKLRKSKNEFYNECSACGTSSLFFTNPA